LITNVNTSGFLTTMLCVDVASFNVVSAGWLSVLKRELANTLFAEINLPDAFYFMHPRVLHG